MDGAIPIRGSDPVTAANRTDSRAVDLRWVETRVVRPIAYRVTERPTALPVTAHPRLNTPPGPTEEEVAPSTPVTGAQIAPGVAPPVQSTPYATALTLLQEWVKEDDAVR